jgi:hypothetical protein
MGQYLVLIYEDEQKWIDQAQGAAEGMAAHYQFNQAHAAEIVVGKALQPTMTATSVRHGLDGGVEVTDGPFVETKEALGGFYLIEAPDRPAALELAKQIPAPFGGHEVRPVRVFES